MRFEWSARLEKHYTSAVHLPLGQTFTRVFWVSCVFLLYKNLKMNLSIYDYHCVMLSIWGLARHLQTTGSTHWLKQVINSPQATLCNKYVNMYHPYSEFLRRHQILNNRGNPDEKVRQWDPQPTQNRELSINVCISEINIYIDEMAPTSYKPEIVLCMYCFSKIQKLISYK